MYSKAFVGPLRLLRMGVPLGAGVRGTLALLGFGVAHGVGIMDSHTSVWPLRTPIHRCGATR